MFKSPFELLVNAVTVEPCVICNYKGLALCHACYENAFSEPDYRCYICNKLTRQGSVCKSCKPRSRLRHVWWLGDYKTELKELVLQMKYQRKRETARLLGAYLAQKITYLPEDTLVVHLPTASSRVRRRGFDQAQLIAQSFAEARHLTYRNALQRTGQKELIGKRRIDRMKAMQGVFKLQANTTLSGKSILLVDDVLTTGASLESAATTLREAGAQHVAAVVVARRLLN